MNVSMLKVFTTDNPDTLRSKALHWANTFGTACYFDSNGYSDPYSAFDVLIAAGSNREVTYTGSGSFDRIDDFLSGNHAFIPGYFAYDLKNEIEVLGSHNPDHLDFPDIHFFLPEHTILIKGKEVQIYSDKPDTIWKELNGFVIPIRVHPDFRPEIQSRFSRAEYIKSVKELPNGIWLDYQLKDLNGLEVMAAIKESEIWHTVPVFVVSNSASQEKMLNMLALGAKKYYLKAEHKLDEIIDGITSYLKEGV